LSAAICPLKDDQGTADEGYIGMNRWVGLGVIAVNIGRAMAKQQAPLVTSANQPRYAPPAGRPGGFCFARRY
jgi:hypothetical protein